MSKNYDLIATVDIDIASPIVDDASFDNLIIIGPPPKTTPAKAPPAVGVYSSVEEVLAAGWVTSGENADPVGVAAQVAFEQSPRPAMIYIAPMQMLTVAEAESEGNSAVVEKAVVTAQRAMGTTGWYVLCTAGVDPEEYEEIAAYIESQEKMFCYTETGFFGKCSEKDGGNKPSVGTSYYRTCGIYGCETTNQLDDDMSSVNRYMNVAWVAKWLNYSAGSETTAFKVLASVCPSKLSSMETKALEKGNLNYFITVGNKNITMNGKTMAGEWADIIRFRDWLKNDMQVRVANLFIARPKVPYTDAGIALVQNQMMASLKEGQDAGCVAEDEFDEYGNTIPGYTTSVPRASSLSSAEKSSRRLKKCFFKARLTGAIHFAELKGSLTYEL